MYIGKTGLSGYEFREHVLMQRFGIQINKTSINSVLLIFTIGVTWSSVNFLLDALRRAAETLDRERAVASNAERRLLERRTRALTSDLPGLPDFSEFDSAFRSTPTSPDGDIRAAFYAAYDDADREYIPLRQAVGLLSSGRRLVSTSFVVPYPPGSPSWSPGKASPQPSSTSSPNSTSRRSTATAPRSACPSSPKPPWTGGPPQQATATGTTR